ncbi:hypothetical protein CW370_04410 [Bacillus sp. SN32]|nr:hypothetical protein CW370_04410 [Bacillus sp. SN32]
MTVSLENLDDLELTLLYSKLLKELKCRGIIRTNNVVGELGEYLTINFYNKTKGLPKLQAAPTGTQNIDALSIKGDRYSIKTTTGNVTGVFYGLNDPEVTDPDVQKFEYVIIVLFDKEYALKGIYELSWDSFIKHKRWHKRMRAWNLSITKSLIADSKVIHEKFVKEVDKDE